MQVRRNPPLNGDGVPDGRGHLADALVQMWVDVTNVGGAVGFVAPVTTEEVRTVAESAFARVEAGADDLVVAFEGDDAVAFGFLAINEFVLARHWGTVKRLQRTPKAYGRGAGALVLAELEACARDRGLERVCLTVRGRTGRERFYLAHGYRVDACLPGRLRLAEGVTVEELHMSKVVTGAGTDRPPEAAGTSELLVQRLDPDLPLPSYAHPGDAGLDLCAAADVELAPGQRAVVATGVAIALPDGHVGLVHPRSGLAARHGLALVNAPGTIDAGYRGEVKVIVVNLDPTQTVKLQRGDRIAQLVIQPVTTVAVREVDDLGATPRGGGGFGSTGR